MKIVVTFSVPPLLLREKTMVNESINLFVMKELELHKLNFIERDVFVNTKLRFAGFSKL